MSKLIDAINDELLKVAGEEFKAQTSNNIATKIDTILELSLDLMASGKHGKISTIEMLNLQQVRENWVKSPKDIGQ